MVSHDDRLGGAQIDSDASIVKPRIYASAGIPEYWIVDRHPTDRRDAIIEYFKLSVSGAYERTGDAVLSDLEKAG